LKTFAFDIEVLKNLFTLTAINVDDENERHVFYVGLGKTDFSDVKKFLRNEMTLVGYNSDSYDLPILRFIWGYNGDKLNAEVYNLSGKLVDDNNRNDRAIIELRYPRKTIYPWKSIDLMRILGLDKVGVSLKQVAVNLSWPKIQDMPVDFTASVQVVQLESVLSYNANDVLITKRLYEEIAPMRQLREDLGKIYNVDFTNASDSKMANLIFENVYANELHLDIRSIRDMRTIRDKVLLGDCIAPFVRFETPELNAMLDRVSATVVYGYNNFKYSESIYFANCSFSLGVGGLHSEDAPGIFVSDDKYIIQDCDASSYYPNLIINNNFYPEHLGVDFIRVLKRITSERLAAKKSGNKVKADGLKITVNSTFGKFGSQHFWLQDAKQLLSTTLTGQMGLLMLIEGMYLNGISVISCNTDGVVCRIPRNLEGKYKEVAKAWEKATSIELEFTPYKKYVRRDVNTYITEKADGTIKEKGAFSVEIDLKRAYHMPIVAKALRAYYINGIPIRKTLDDCKDIMDFCISQKTGANFAMELHTTTGIQHLQKTNRFFISTQGGSLIKRDRTSKKMIGLQAGHLVTILNDYDPSLPFNNYKVDLHFYEKEVAKIIDEIEPKQISLFDVSALGKSTLKKMDAFNAREENINEENPSVNTLNKLGKNQLARRLESIVKNNQTISNISPRYVYVVDFDGQTMLADIYCFAKGVRRVMGIDKHAYKKTHFEKGSLLFCNRFAKLPTGGHAVVEYRIVNKIEEEKTNLDGL
jgi:hypothetical protein